MPPKVTAGLARSRVSGYRRSPAPPASNTPSVSFIGNSDTKRKMRVAELFMLTEKMWAGQDGSRARLPDKKPSRRIRRRGCRVRGARSGCVVDADAQRLEEAHVVGVDGEFRFAILAARTDQLGRGLNGVLIAAVEADRGFQHQEDVKSLFFDLGDDLGYLLGLGKRTVDGLAEVFHQLF